MIRPCRLRPASVACIAALALAVLSGPAPAAAQEWRPAKLTILLGQTLNGLDGRIVQALAHAWRAQLGAPVEIAARGRGSLLSTAGEFVLRPRDGTVVLAADLGNLALAYARERPGWTWGRSFEHLGVYASDPAVVFAAADAGIDGFGDLVSAARQRPLRIGVGRWLSLETLLVQDIAAQAGLKLVPVPAGSGESLLAAVIGGKVPAALGRHSDIAPRAHDVNVLAAARAIGPAAGDGAGSLDAALGTASVPAGRFGTITVHAGFQRAFPARFNSLKRSFARAVGDEEFRETLAKLGLVADGTGGAGHPRLMAVVRRWWDVYGRVGGGLKAAPTPVTTRGKITVVAEEGRVLRYLGLDGKQHDLRADGDATALTVGGVAVTGAEPLKAIRVGMICEIAWPDAIALEASRLSCK